MHGLFTSCVGNARVAGMAADVGLVGLKYNVIAAVFFVSDLILDVISLLTTCLKIPYALAEVPS